MDDEFENIILDEVDDLNGLESLREKAVKNKNNNDINNSKDHNKKINNNKKENESKEISEEYNDFDYNIEENEDNKIMKENNLNNISNEKIKKIENTVCIFDRIPDTVVDRPPSCGRRSRKEGDKKAMRCFNY